MLPARRPRRPPTDPARPGRTPGGSCWKRRRGCLPPRPRRPPEDTGTAASAGSGSGWPGSGLAERAGLPRAPSAAMTPGGAGLGAGRAQVSTRERGAGSGEAGLWEGRPIRKGPGPPLPGDRPRPAGGTGSGWPGSAFKMASPQGGPMAIAMRLRNQLQSVYKMDPLRNEEEVRVKIKDLNEHIVCCLCAGYFVDATTITECLHTFCKSCIVKYLQTSKYCPMCNIKIHETQPLLNLKLDRVMQDIVYKLVPGLQDSEEKRIREFYQSRGLDRVTQPTGEEPAPGTLGLPFNSFDHSKAHYYRYDEQLSLCLEKLSSGKDKSKSILQHKFVRCSVRAEVRHLRRVLCRRLMLNPQHVQLLFDNEVLPDHMTMKQIWLSRWFGKPAPLLLHYSVKEKRR
uniref:Polycomb group RING finger protein 1 n=3 Tax=Sarcophilus harrisii TaxID=9305 RepID=A0A7N4V4J5_SARHA